MIKGKAEEKDKAWMTEQVKNEIKQIYQTHQNKINEYWNQEKKKETYETEMERIEEQDREDETNEDIPIIVLDPYKKVKVNRFEISEEEMKKLLEKLKTGKSAGLRAELYKELINDRRAIEKLTASYKKMLEEKQEPTEWKKSKTIMISMIYDTKKKNRPTDTELRPIAMTDVSYKILMSLIGREIEKHVAENKKTK